MAAKRKAEIDVEGDLLEIMPLGAGSEVGRSCVMLKFKGKTIMFDCGLHPAYNGLSALPYFDEVDPSEIDLLLVTHFHLDHCGAVPYFLEKTTFAGRTFMTHPTKAIYKLLLTDYVKVSNIAVEDMLFDEQALNRSMSKIELIDYHQELEHNGIKFWCYNAGHVLGAAMFMVEIAGIRILYTGDFSREEDRHLRPAETPSVSTDVLVVESTYGVQVHETRNIREARFTGMVHEVVKRGGRCLLPVFALGRAQELLLILDEYWENHPELRDIPVYYASSLAKKTMTIFQTYINMMGDNVRAKFASGQNPFVFKHISNLRSMDHFDDVGPSVVMASPGMLQSGLSRDLFERWCSDRRNGVVFTGYCVEGTLAKHVMTEPPDVTLANGQKSPLNMSVSYISFSAHSDFLQTSNFIDILRPPNIVLVHGDSNEMGRLKGALNHKYQDKIQIFTPKNCQPVKMTFRGEKMAKVIGSLASAPLAQGQIVKGIVVREEFNHLIMAPTDLSNFTTLSTSTVQQKQKVPFVKQFRLLQTYLQQLYDNVETGLTVDNAPMLTVRLGEKLHDDEKPAGGSAVAADSVQLTQCSPDYVLLQWMSTPVTDMIADSIVLVILQMETSPSPGLLKVMSQTEDDREIEARNRRVIFKLLKEQYGDVHMKDGEVIEVNLDDNTATIDLENADISCSNETFKARIQTSLRRIQSALYPLID